MKKRTGFFLLTVLLPLCLAVYALIMLPQDRIFSEYKQAFRQLQHPPGTTFIAWYNSFGALDKIRVMYKDDFTQGCDYRVAQIREYSGNRADVLSFYARQHIRVRGESLSPGVLFIPMNDTGAVDPYELSDEDLAAKGPGAFDLLENIQYDQRFLGLKAPSLYYYVAIGGFSSTDYDLRCRY
jgi:hypothetical protein